MPTLCCLAQSTWSCALSDLRATRSWTVRWGATHTARSRRQVARCRKPHRDVRAGLSSPQIKVQESNVSHQRVSPHKTSIHILLNAEPINAGRLPPERIPCFVKLKSKSSVAGCFTERCVVSATMDAVRAKYRPNQTRENGSGALAHPSQSDLHRVRVLLPLRRRSRRLQIQLLLEQHGSSAARYVSSQNRVRSLRRSLPAPHGAGSNWVSC